MFFRFLPNNWSIWISYESVSIVCFSWCGAKYLFLVGLLFVTDYQTVGVKKLPPIKGWIAFFLLENFHKKPDHLLLVTVWDDQNWTSFLLRDDLLPDHFCSLSISLQGPNLNRLGCSPELFSRNWPMLSLIPSTPYAVTLWK